MSLSGADQTGQACDALSIGGGFDAVEAQTGDVTGDVAASPRGPDDSYECPR